jgi:preprotein translocase subunit SecD
MIHIANWTKVMIVAICALGVLYAAPNFFDKDVFSDVPAGLPGKQMNLGLDLRGGAHLLMQVDSDVIVKDRLGDMMSETRAILRGAKVRYHGLAISGQAIVFRLADATQTDVIKDEVEALYQPSGFSALGTAEPEVTVEVGDNAAFTLRLSEQGINDRVRNAVEQIIKIMSARIDPAGTLEPIIQRQGRDRILLQVPGVSDAEVEKIKKRLKTQAKMTFHLIDQANSLEAGLQGRVPAGSMLLPSNQLGSDGKAIRYLVQKRVRVHGERLVDAQPSFDESSRPVVSFRFDTIGGQKFGKVTANNVGRLLAIVLDNKVISAPRIQSPILGGAGIITGSFTVEETKDLSLLLRAGALPAPVTFLEERSVGPGLGQDSIDSGKIASIIGMALVIVFMVIFYGLFGLFANVALFFNIALIAGMLSVLQATLTLPGIAGIVLTIGMAVDANVLIFERIREEVRNGRTPISAIDSGYRRAMTTIIDANVTTLIAAILLYAFGTGPIKGFAVTLSIGLMTSMFTAIMVTRLIIVIWLRRTRPQVLPL